MNIWRGLEKAKKPGEGLQGQQRDKDGECGAEGRRPPSPPASRSWGTYRWLIPKVRHNQRPRLPAGLLSRMYCPGDDPKLLKGASHLRAHFSSGWKDQPVFYR